MNVSKMNATTNNVNVAPKTEEKPEVKNNTEGYAEKSKAPTDANLYKAMYNVQTAKTEAGTAKNKTYESAAREYLEKWGTDEQLREFYGEKKAPANKTDKTSEDEAYERAMRKYLENHGTAEQLQKFEEGVKAKHEKPAVESTPKKNDDDSYKSAAREYLEKWGTDEQLREFDKNAEAKKSEEDNEYYRQYQEYKHKYE